MFDIVNWRFFLVNEAPKGFFFFFFRSSPLFVIVAEALSLTLMKVREVSLIRGFLIEHSDIEFTCI